MGPKRVMWVRRYQGQCRALRPLGHQGYRLRSHNKDRPLCSGYIGAALGNLLEILTTPKALMVILVGGVSGGTYAGPWHTPPPHPERRGRH